MILTDEQQELLHAWVDGEATEAEGVIATELLSKSAEARTYIAELERLRLLLATHGGVSAPEGLHERVRLALKIESQTPVYRLPVANWRTLAVAVAAVVIVSLALIFTPGIYNTEPGTSADVAAHHSSQSIPIQSDPDAGPFAKSGAAIDESLRDADKLRDAQPADDKATPPETGNDQSEKKASRTSNSVLHLDRTGQPIEISVNLNRQRDVSTVQVYNDMLLVCCFYGDARLADNGSKTEVDEDFAGHDFATCDSLEVEVESNDLPQLLAALDRMAGDQGYGSVVLPGDLREETDDSNNEARKLRELADLVENERAPNTATSEPRTQGYLPPELQRECLRRQAADLGADDHDANELKTALGRMNKRSETTGDHAVTKDIQHESHKVKLLIRLR